MIIELKADSSLAKIETNGAELISLKDVFGQEYMWQKDSKYWSKCSPVLFPSIGCLRNDKVKIKGDYYQIPKHGFCKDMEFKVLYQSDCKAILNCSYTDETLKLYPYKFSLTMTYSLEGGHITIDYTVLNMDEQPIDYCLGAHPGFNVPIGEGEFEDYCLEFNRNEDSPCPVFDAQNAQIAVDNCVDYTKGTNKLQLKYDYFDNDAIIFDKINSDSVKLYSIKTGRGVQLDFSGFNSIAFWTPTKMQAPFLCIEPWNGMAVRSDEDDNYENKYGIKHLDINQQHTYRLSIVPM